MTQNEIKLQVIIECLAERVVEMRDLLRQIDEDLAFNTGPSQGTRARILQVLGSPNGAQKNA
jgi:hypothetical protein